MIALNTIDIEELQDQAEWQGETICQPIDLGLQFNLPQRMGRGAEKTIDLRQGLTIQIREATLWQPMSLVQQHEGSFPLTAKFYLSGCSRVQTLNQPDMPAEYEELEGYHYLYHLPNLTEVEHWVADRALHILMVFVEASYFNSPDLEDMALPKPLQKLIAGDLTQRFHQPLGKISPVMKQVIGQILHCPYQGAIGRLYLESKALELFTLQFDHWARHYCVAEFSPLSLRLSSSDIERLHYAREILLEQFDQPPSLIEIARRVGLNDCKLKQGFRQIYGTTLFGYLHDYRMQQAQHLLRHSDLSIAHIAAAIGYRNPEAFSTAFRKKFAVTPKTYQLGHHN
jgi:AraC family transcriptional regulator, transcriptional activator of the genes for pyochelin and ferripyochelin receptors